MVNKTLVLYENRDVNEWEEDEDYDLGESDYSLKGDNENYWNELSYHLYGE